MSIGDVVNIRCRGSRKFTILFIGKTLVVVMDEFGEEMCVDVKNIRRRL